MLCLQFILNLFPFSFFILEKDPGSQDGTKIDESEIHENMFDLPLDGLVDSLSDIIKALSVDCRE